MANGNLTEALINFALNTKYDDIPSEVLKTQKKSLLDSIGVMAAATTLEPACRPFMDFAVENSVGGDCSIVGTGMKASPILAAMANGALIHALDYEDGHDDAKAHPNTASTPVLLALGESLGKSGRDVLAAMVVSSEICCRLKMSLLTNDLQLGWYSPPMYSAYGAVLGAAGLLGMEPGQALDALSICMTQIMMPGQSAWSGRSVLRGIREAFSAKAAMFSLDMAGRGVIARMDQPLEGELGLFKAIARGQYDPGAILDGLGQRWESGRLRFKPWPCCGTTHAVVDAMFELMAENSVTADEVREISLVVNPIHMNVLGPREVKYRPKSLAAAKFSLPFSIALGLKNGGITLDMYREEALESPELLAIADRVTYTVRTVEPERPKRFYGDDHVEVTLRTARGDFAKETFASAGSPEKPLSETLLRQKYFDCMSHSGRDYGADRCREILGAVGALQETADIRSLTRLFE